VELPSARVSVALYGLKNKNMEVIKMSNKPDSITHEGWCPRLRDLKKQCVCQDCKYVYFLEYNRTVVGIHTDLQSAKDAIKDKETELFIITKVPLNLLLSTEDFKDKLGYFNHWHWDVNDGRWLGDE